MVTQYVWVNCCRARLKYQGDVADLDRLLEQAFDRRWGVLPPFQSRHELRVLLELVQQHRPRRLLEIGTARGGTFSCLARVAAEDACLIKRGFASRTPWRWLSVVESTVLPVV